MQSKSPLLVIVTDRFGSILGVASLFEPTLSYINQKFKKPTLLLCGRPQVAAAVRHCLAISHDIIIVNAGPCCWRFSGPDKRLDLLWSFRLLRSQLSSPILNGAILKWRAYRQGLDEILKRVRIISDVSVRQLRKIQSSLTYSKREVCKGCLCIDLWQCGLSGSRGETSSSFPPDLSFPLIDTRSIN